ncbi:MAG: hypothetical protein KIT31_38010 [Deltaproteobacteria bacterium]|nr:hypothetical protein [Deltaproteobacteria bacterium]
MTVEVSARKFSIPFECPCCGAEPDSEITLSAGRTRGLVFPYCARCVAHVIAWESAGVPSAATMLLGIIAAIVVGLAAGPLFGALVVAVTIPIVLAIARAMRKRAGARCAQACAGPGRALAYLGWDGNASRFQFESPTYTARFAEQNDKRLVNVTTALRKLVDHYRIARLQVPTPVVAVSAVGAPLSPDAWIERLAASGTVARRHAFLRAMEAIHDPAARARIVAAGANLEAANVLERAEGLPGAEGRLLFEQALVDVRLDNLPDDLEEAVVRLFEERLRST